MSNIKTQGDLIHILQYFGGQYNDHPSCPFIISLFDRLQSNSRSDVLSCTGVINGGPKNGIASDRVRFRLQFGSRGSTYDLWTDREGRVRMDVLEENGEVCSSVYDMFTGVVLEQGSVEAAVEQLKDRVDKTASGEYDPEMFDGFKGDRPLSQPGETIDTINKVQRVWDRTLKLLIQFLERLRTK